MGKGSTRRVEDSEAIRRNWDAVFGAKNPIEPKVTRRELHDLGARIRLADAPQTEREVTPPALADHICRIEGCDP